MYYEKEGKRWSVDQKIKIVKEASTKGVRETLEQYSEMGKDGFAHCMTKEPLARIKDLEQEVDCLKQLLAEKEIESKLKDELLKKKYPKVKRKRSYSKEKCLK